MKGTVAHQGDQAVVPSCLSEKMGIQRGYWFGVCTNPPFSGVVTVAVSPGASWPPTSLPATQMGHYFTF